MGVAHTLSNMDIAISQMKQIMKTIIAVKTIFRSHYVRLTRASGIRYRGSSTACIPAGEFTTSKEPRNFP